MHQNRSSDKEQSSHFQRTLLLIFSTTSRTKVQCQLGKIERCLEKVKSTNQNWNNLDLAERGIFRVQFIELLVSLHVCVVRSSLLTMKYLLCLTIVTAAAEVCVENMYTRKGLQSWEKSLIRSLTAFAASTLCSCSVFSCFLLLSFSLPLTGTALSPPWELWTLQRAQRSMSQVRTLFWASKLCIIFSTMSAK